MIKHFTSKRKNFVNNMIEKKKKIQSIYTSLIIFELFSILLKCTINITKIYLIDNKRKLEILNDCYK